MEKDLLKLQQDLSELTITVADLINRVMELESARNADTSIYLNGAPEYVRKHVIQRAKEKSKQ